MASTTLTIAGNTINLDTYVLGRLTAYSKDGTPSLSLYRRGGALPGLPDPWLGGQVVLQIGGTTYFKGDVVSASPGYDSFLGWTVAYQCLGLRYRGNTFPYTDENSGTDTSAFNLMPDDPNYQASLAGRTTGQILTNVLTEPTNATNLNSAGIGAYTSLSPPTLPATTVADLAVMTTIPPAPVYLGGQKLIGVLDAFLQAWAPNYTLWIDPDTGAIRFLDTRLFGGTGYNTSGAHTFTLGTDLVEPTPLSRDTTECYQRVMVRGQPWVEPVLLSLSNGGLQEGWNTTDDGNWTPSSFLQPGAPGAANAADSGTVATATETTTTVVITSDDTTRHWPANYWDQTATGRAGIINLAYTGGGGTITQYVTRRIVANTAMTAAGTSTVTLDMPLPITTFNKYTIFGLQGGISNVWRLYKTTNVLVGAALQNTFPYQTAYVGVGGLSASLTSSPVGSVVWSAAKASPWNQFPIPFVQIPGSGGKQGQFLFVAPTINATGGLRPQPSGSGNIKWDDGSTTGTRNGSGYGDVQVLAAVATGATHAFAPANLGGSMPGTPPSTPGYSEGVAVYTGTSHSVEGLSRTLVVTVPQWRDPGNIQSMIVYANELLDSVKDAIVEGEITILVRTGTELSSLLSFLKMGMSVAVTGNGYTTGWENTSSLTSFSRGLQVVMADLDWHPTGPVPWTLTLRCSNRRAYNSATMFLKPDRTGLTWGAASFAVAGVPGVGPVDLYQLRASVWGQAGLLPPLGPIDLGEAAGMLGPRTNWDQVPGLAADQAGAALALPPDFGVVGPEPMDGESESTGSTRRPRGHRYRVRKRPRHRGPRLSTPAAIEANRRRAAEQAIDEPFGPEESPAAVARRETALDEAFGPEESPAAVERQARAMDEAFGPEEAPPRRGPLTGGLTTRERTGAPLGPSAPGPLRGGLTARERAGGAGSPFSHSPLTGGLTGRERAIDEPFGPEEPSPPPPSLISPESGAFVSPRAVGPIEVTVPPPRPRPEPPGPGAPLTEAEVVKGMSPFNRAFTAPARAITRGWRGLKRFLGG